MTLREAALVAGIGYLVSFVFSFGNTRRDKLVVRGDAAATASNIRASESQFRVGIATWVVTLAADLVVAWALYFFLKPVSESLSLLTAWLRLVYVAIAAFPVINLLLVPLLLSSADDRGGTQPVQRDAQATLLLRSLHILGLGYLIVRSDYVPTVLGVLLIVTSVAYLIDSFACFLSSSYENNKAHSLVFAIPAIISEFSLTVWLLIWGG